MKALLLITIVLFSLSCYSQEQKIDFKNLDAISKVEFQHDYTRYCLKKYHDVKINAYKWQIGGLVVAAAGFVIPVSETIEIYNGGTSSQYTVRTKDNTIRTITAIGGGVMSLVGFIKMVDSERWLKKAYIGPDGIGVRFQF